jgi:CelD/BcsL family acetyltransferase involved in cellulose biosynthesis
MTTLTNDAARPAASRRANRAAFVVEFEWDWAIVARDWDAVRRRGQATPFQNGRWLAAWYDAFSARSDVQPLLATIRDAATGEIALRLPLIRRTVGGLRIIEFADLDLTDYNAPVLGPAAPRDAGPAEVLWRELRRALRRLPGGADLIRFKKIPFHLRGTPNPLAMPRAAGPCSLEGNLVVAGEDFDQHRRLLKREVRKVLDRCWRNFNKYPSVAFRIVTDPDEALCVLAVLDEQQGTRMRELGANFVLAEGSNAAFYRNLIRSNAASGYVVLSMLTAGEEVVAILFGVRDGTRYVMLRISNAGEKWSHCSPGRLVIDRTMAALHGQGVREFDFSVGEYEYKRRFGATPVPLADISAALSWRGIPHAMRDRAVHELRRYPALSARVKRMLGKAPPQEN